MAIDKIAKPIALVQKEHQLKKNKKHRKGRKFAVGMGEEEETGESISLKDHDVVTVRKDIGANSTKFGAADLGVRFLAKNSKFIEGYGPKEKMGETIKLGDHDVVTMLKPEEIDMSPKSDKHGSKFLPVNYMAKNAKKFKLEGKKFAEGYGAHEKMGEEIKLRDHDVVTILKPEEIDMSPKSDKHGATPLTVKYLAKKAHKINLGGMDTFHAQKAKFQNLAQKIIKLPKDGAAAGGEEAKVDFELAGEKGPGMPKLNGTVRGEKEW
jgi:hypothetical protein